MTTLEADPATDRIPGLERPRQLRLAPPRRHRSWPRVLLVLLVAGLLGWQIYATVGPWLEYRRAHVITQDATVVAPRTQVGARIHGLVVSLAAAPGAAVKKGDVLAQLEDSHLRLQVERRRVEERLAEHQREVEALAIAQDRRGLELKLEASVASEKGVRAELQRAESDLVRRESEYARFAELRTSGTVPASDIDRATAARDEAAAEVLAARAEIEGAAVAVRMAQQDLDALQVREAGLSVLDSKIELARAETAVADAELLAATVRAPLDGRVVEWLIGPGGSVRVGQPIVALELESGLFIQAWIDQASMADVASGSLAEITLDSRTGGSFEGIIESVEPLVAFDEEGDPVHASRSSLLPRASRACLHVVPKDPHPELAPGMSARVSVLRGG